MVRKSFIKSLYNEKLNLWENIEDIILYNEPMIFLRHCGRFLKRLPKYLKLCWNTENWDSSYLYDYLEMFMKELLRAQEEDTWHVEKGVKRRIKQIKICLAYLDRYRNWTDYYDYPMDDIKHVPTEDGKFYRMIHTNSYNEAQRKGAHGYEMFNREMFWKRFMQWFDGWWT